MRYLSFSHIGLTCNDPLAVERFYTTHFGFRRARVYEPGLGIRTTFWSLPRLSAGNRQARINNTVRRHVNLQMPGHLTFACNTRLHCGHFPSCINRVVVPPMEGINIYADERSLLHFVSDIGTCLNHL